MTQQQIDFFVRINHVSRLEVRSWTNVYIVWTKIALFRFVQYIVSTLCMNWIVWRLVQQNLFLMKLLNRQTKNVRCHQKTPHLYKHSILMHVMFVYSSYFIFFFFNFFASENVLIWSSLTFKSIERKRYTNGDISAKR